MKNAPSPKEVVKVILQAIQTCSNSLQCLFRYTVGEDVRTLTTAQRAKTAQRVSTRRLAKKWERSTQK